MLETEYLGRELEDGDPAAPSAAVHRDHIGVHRQHDGRNYIGTAPMAGRTSGTVLVEVARLAALDLPARPSAFRRGAMACTGLQFCKLALVETKQRAADLVSDLEAGFPDFDGKIRLNVDGCPNSCARYQLADIGLAGGESAGEGNYQLHLGGDLGEGRAFGRRVRERVLADDAGPAVQRLVAAYLTDRFPGESLQAWLRREPDESLAAAVG